MFSLKLIQKSIRCIPDYWFRGSIALCSYLFSAAAWADVVDPTLDGSADMGTAAQKITAEAGFGVTAALTLAQAFGIAIALSGAILWRRVAQDKSQKSHGQAVITIFIGALCYFLPYAMGAAGKSLLSPV